ncbi:SulP family inorganic anion transporter [Gordonia sp. (in: high G+C Gram-positive bacteria)]|uniref:SulP family inorganic anion transporter n=1 Tax=Gordonia sp. (in: high G+C Gram-positive bacteria) TaxID=84139 RepID=UPI0025BB9691|nr:SulP family inorganic anion transporter [Gordonia sp. (in: high G+C Gram-positive bacteria)]
MTQRAQQLRIYLRRFGSRKTVPADLRAGVVLGAESVPDGLAAGVLAGVNPLAGLNAYLVGTVVGALTTGSVYMTVQATGAMAVIIADVPAVHGEGSERVLATLGLMTGAVMLFLGLARLGSLVRYIPTAVLIGFANAVAINIVLGQLSNLTGYASDSANRVTRAVDTALHFWLFSWPSVLVGATTITLILVLERFGLGPLSLVCAVIAGSALVQALPNDSVTLLRDSVAVGRSLPIPVVPSLASMPELVVAALSLALVGLVQGAGISGSIPNPDGRYPDASADFRGQGIANVASGLFQGVPVGGSMSGTALARAAGARSALTNLVAGVVMVVVILACGPLIGYVAMPAIAGLLILVGIRTVKPDQIALALRTGPIQIAVFVVTFVLSLIIPLQYAVLAGVGMSVILHVARQANRIRIVQWTFDDSSTRPVEEPPPATVDAGETLILTAYGALFFASAQSFREQLPAPADDATDATVVLRLRGTEELGVTFLSMLGNYRDELARAGATLMLSGVDENLASQLEVTGVLARLGRENVFPARTRFGDSVWDALAAIDKRRKRP